MASGVLLLTSGLAGPAAADTLPSPSGSPSSTPPGVPSPSPSFSATGNAPPEFLQCPGIIVQAGAPESIGFQVTDPDGDRVTLTAAGSSVGAQTSIQGDTLTYTAPPTYTGQDFIAVTADDGRGGAAVCDLSIRVEAQPGPTPTPTPTPTTSPSPTPTQEPTTPAPSPTSSTPAPSQAPTSGPAPTAEPSPAPSTPDTAAPTTPPSRGNDSESASGTPDATGPGEGSNDGAGGGDASESGGPDNGTEPTPEDGTADPSGSADPATATQRLQDLTHETTVSCSLQAVEDARTLLQGISAGMASRPGSGSFPEAGPGEQDGTDTHDPDSGSTPAAASDRTSEVTGSSIWLFTGVGLSMLVLIGLAAAALPRGSRRH